MFYGFQSTSNFNPPHLQPTPPTSTYPTYFKNLKFREHLIEFANSKSDRMVSQLISLWPDKNILICKQRNWVFAPNSNFLIPISLQNDCVNLWYFKLRLIDQTECIAWNIKGLRHGLQRLGIFVKTLFRIIMDFLKKHILNKKLIILKL